MLTDFSFQSDTHKARITGCKDANLLNQPQFC